MNFMPVRYVAAQGLTHPFGDHRTVHQAFPAAIPYEQSDPFLMCDYFNVKEEKGPVTDPDDFPINWHPHRGFDVCSYLRTGVGRHGDSLGNRETYQTPGMQWMSTGSGVVHAEGGATPKGLVTQGFQIWINVPASRKLDDPRYGTVPTDQLPLVQLNDSHGQRALARILAGTAYGIKGPFQTVQSVLMIDFDLEPGGRAALTIENAFDTVMLYVYEGVVARINNHNDLSNDTQQISHGNVILLDASLRDQREVEFVTGSHSAKILLFAGKKLREKIEWYGPIVMSTREQIIKTFQELNDGSFPPKRVDWDYKRIASKPTTT